VAVPEALRTPTRTVPTFAVHHVPEDYPIGTEMRRALKIAALAILLIALGVWYKECVVVDSCYDQGGYWDRDQGRCIRTPPEVTPTSPNVQ
jgi:hypothetical protein